MSEYGTVCALNGDLEPSELNAFFFQQLRVIRDPLLKTLCDLCIVRVPSILCCLCPVQCLEITRFVDSGERRTLRGCGFLGSRIG